MGKHHAIQQVRGEALNAIRKIYHPLYKFPYSNYHTEDGGYAEQREYKIASIIERLNKKEKAIIEKYKKKEAKQPANHPPIKWDK